MGMGQDDMAGSYKKSPSAPARATLSCVKFSHPFQNRTLVLEPKSPVKIGRLGPHVSCAHNNAIFDCVVISRDHARIWFEDGNFYLQDTKSSNGTFVNNELIGEKAKDSPPMIVYTGDIVQFGSAVFSPDMKSRLGSIIAVLKLYLPDGSEALTRPPSSSTTSAEIPVVQLYQLSACLQEAEHREQKLRKKMVILQHIVEASWKATGESWKALVNEDILITKLDFLQRRLDVFVRDSPDDRLRHEMVQLKEGQCVTLEKSKKDVEQALLERNEAIQKREDLERYRENLESECAFYKTIAKQSQDDLKDLGQKYTLYFEKYQVISQKVETDKNLQEKCKILELEKRQLKEHADKVVAEKELLEKCLIAFQSAGPVAPGMHADLSTKDLLESKPEAPSAATKPKFNVALVNQNLEINEDVTSKLEPNDQVQSRIDILLQRFERIERVENIRVEKVKNIRLQLENLKAQNKSSDDLKMPFSLNECMDSIESDLSLILPKNNKSSKTDIAAVDNTKYANGVINNLKADNTRLNLQLSEAEDSLRYLEAKKDLYQMDFKTLTLKSIEIGHENEELKKKVATAHAEITAKNNRIFELKKKTFLLEKSSEADLQHVETVQGKLEELQVQNDQLKRDCDSCREEMAQLQEVLKKSREECAKMETSAEDLTSDTAALEETCARLRAECARNEASKKTYQAAQDDFIELNQKLFEQMGIIEQMQTDLAAVERERASVCDLIRELAEARHENENMARRIDYIQASADPALGYFLPLVAALFFVFAVVLLSQRTQQTQIPDSTR